MIAESLHFSRIRAESNALFWPVIPIRLRRLSPYLKRFSQTVIPVRLAQAAPLQMARFAFDEAGARKRTAYRPSYSPEGSVAEECLLSRIMLLEDGENCMAVASHFVQGSHVLFAVRGAHVKISPSSLWLKVRT